WLRKAQDSRAPRNACPPAHLESNPSLQRHHANKLANRSLSLPSNCCNRLRLRVVRAVEVKQFRIFHRTVRRPYNLCLFELLLKDHQSKFHAPTLRKDPLSHESRISFRKQPPDSHHLQG